MQVVRGGQSPPQNLADQLTLFKPGADYGQHITICPPGFKKLSTPLKHLSMEFTFNKIIVDQKNCSKKVCSVHVENTCRTAEAKRMIKAYNKKKPNSQLVEILFEQAFIFLCMLGVY